MPRVFLVEEARKDLDLSTARKFGTVETLFDHRVRRASIVTGTQFWQDVSERLKEVKFNPDEDFFCLVGSILSVSQGLGVLVAMFPTRRIKFLAFNSMLDRYVEVDVNLNSIKG